MKFVPQHLNFFLEIPPETQGPVGAGLRPWAASLRFPPTAEPSGKLSDEVLKKLPPTALCRDALRKFCAQAEMPIAFLAVAAWGGMHRLHGSRAWQARAKWLPALEEIRASGRARGEDFAVLHKLQLRKDLPGIGAPYFTKLLFFLRHQSDAYIMDQWTAKSVNLLTGREIVKLSNSGWVGPENDRKCYEEYCDIVDHLATLLGCGGSEAEHALISKGGRKPWKWRQYVCGHFPRPEQKRRGERSPLGPPPG